MQAIKIPHTGGIRRDSGVEQGNDGVCGFGVSYGIYACAVGDSGAVRSQETLWGRSELD